MALPGYLQNAKPVPAGNRAPWFLTTAPAYAGIFLWIAYYAQLGNTLKFGGIVTIAVGLLVAGLLSFALYYLVPGLLGKSTGHPLYIVGTSTFGTTGGYFLPGLFMGVLQIGWYSVATFYATKLVLATFGSTAGPGTLVFIIAGIAWGYIFAFMGALGIQYVARVSQFFPIVALIMIIYTAIARAGTVGNFTSPEPNSLASFCLVLTMVIGFFATAGAAGADFAMNNRSKKDVVLGGLTGISLAALIAGLLPVITVAGVHGSGVDLSGVDPKNLYAYDTAILRGEIFIGNIMCLLFAIGSMAPACFCSFIIGNSFSTMIPSVPRMVWTLGGATIGIILAVTGAAGNLEPFFVLIGASFGPVCGAMAADFLLSGCKWAGPREGVSVPGYVAWALGFIVGILGHEWIGAIPRWHPGPLYAFIVGFIVYAILAKAGLENKTVELPGGTIDPEEAETDTSTAS